MGALAGTYLDVDATASIKLLTVACVPCPSWMIVLHVVVRYENSYYEIAKERVYNESDSSLSR